MSAPEMILVETHGRVGVIRLNRPAALNALCEQLVREMGAQLIPDLEKGVVAFWPVSFDLAVEPIETA